MRLPRGLSGDELAKALGRFGYQVTRQTGSHFRLTTAQPSEHHITVPRHGSLRLGTLSAILRSVADHLGLSKDDLADQLFS